MTENLLSSLSEETNKELAQEGQSQQPIESRGDSVRRDFLAEDFRDKIPNIYEAIIVMSQRARQIGRRQAQVIEQFMASKVRPESDEDDDDEAPRPRDEDDEDAPKLPRFEKPTVLAMNEMHKGQLKYEAKE